MPDVPVLEKELPLAAPEVADEVAASLPTVAIVGLGYVGLPVAVAFGKQRNTIGYYLSSKKVWRLKQFHDSTGEVSGEELRAARHLMVTD
jgi:UDP-N-acetyl-D-galactosamine dehydrogenase